MKAFHNSFQRWRGSLEGVKILYLKEDKKWRFLISVEDKKKVVCYHGVSFVMGIWGMESFLKTEYDVIIYYIFADVMVLHYNIKYFFGIGFKFKNFYCLFVKIHINCIIVR